MQERKAEYPATPDQSFTAQQVAEHLAPEKIIQGTAPLDEVHIRAMRVSIRRLKNTIERKLEKSRYCSMAFTGTEKAALWLGVSLSALGVTYPYKQDEYIPVQDDTTDTLEFLNEKQSVQLNIIREHLGLIGRQLIRWCVKPVESMNPEDWHKLSMSLPFAYQHIQEARMDLGMEVNSALKQEQIAR